MAAFNTFSRLRVALGAAAALGVMALLFHIVAGAAYTGTSLLYIRCQWAARCVTAADGTAGRVPVRPTTIH
jgi:hypothetical protein